MSKNRIALVTGANRGIGFEVCRQLAARGLEVILTSRSAPDCQAAAQALSREGGLLHYHALDVRDPVSISGVKDFVSERFGRLDVLVNNAAVLLDQGVRLLESPVETFEETLATNFFGPLKLCQAFLPMMIAQNYGRVVNVSSEAGSLAGMSGYSPAYSISKAALNALTRVLASEVQRANVKVNSISPGWVRSDMGGPDAPRSLAKGAEGIVWAATLPETGPNGGYFQDGKPLDW